MEGAKEIGKRMRALRKSRRYTQDFLCERLSVKRAAYSRVETGDIYPRIAHLIKLSDIYNVSIDYLVKGKETKPKSDKSENGIEMDKLPDFKRGKTEIRTMIQDMFEDPLLFHTILTYYYEKKSDFMALREKLEEKENEAVARKPITLLD
ncbi:MAG: helix-turn-helix domain-containing protein [Candidatus Omnitrophota bacterium]